jgi:hypothetical protein
MLSVGMVACTAFMNVTHDRMSLRERETGGGEPMMMMMMMIRHSSNGTRVADVVGTAS